ncbi:hypothetical protein Taro_016708 [Colocasia esculenta]|uniref:MULE transposase domain-containing protein n=1 Tax=Colocasia esculenta TaxID=4460 RepID=A0A843UTS3_COLES|nr:hypothetical protein [Colocasia esculenta]
MSIGDQSFIFFIGKDMELAFIHARVSKRLGINMQENMLKYLLPIDGHVEHVLHDDGDVQATFDLHKCQGTSLINLHIHVVDSRCLSTHASRQSGDLPQLKYFKHACHFFGNHRTVPLTRKQSGINDSVQLTIWCNVDVCPWRLHASIIRQGPKFAIKSLNNIHSCGCDIMSDRHPRTSKKWVANAVKGKLLDKPTYRASEMMRDIHRDYGISIPYHQISEQAIICCTGTTNVHYSKTQDRFCLLKWTQRHNVSNAFSYASRHLHMGSKLVADLCSFWTELISNNIVYKASVLNGNNELFTIAYSIADSETYDNWVWFLQILKRVLLSDRRIAFLSDRGKGLKEAIPDIFLNDHHGYCF